MHRDRNAPVAFSAGMEGVSNGFERDAEIVEAIGIHVHQADQSQPAGALTAPGDEAAGEGAEAGLSERRGAVGQFVGCCNRGHFVLLGHGGSSAVRLDDG